MTTSQLPHVPTQSVLADVQAITTEGEIAPELLTLIMAVQELNVLVAGMAKERASLDMTIRDLGRKVDGLASRLRRVESAIK